MPPTMTKENAISMVRRLDQAEAELRSVEITLRGMRTQLVALFGIGRNDAGLVTEPGMENPNG